MNDFSKNLPEACYAFQNMSFADAQSAYYADETVVGIVSEIDSLKKEIHVKLGNNLIGYMTYDETTIYPLTTRAQHNRPLLVPIQIWTLIGKKICAKILSIDNEKIMLSRKNCMLEAYEVIRHNEKLPFYVTAATKRNLFGDVGFGIQAKIHIRELCKTKLYSVEDLFNLGEMFYVKVIGFDELNRANVSYRATFPPYNPAEYRVGDVFKATINTPVDSVKSGFFTSISPQVVGIMDYNRLMPEINYGDKVEVVVHKITPLGLHLRFLKKLT